MACEFPVAVKAKLMLTARHCLLYSFLLLQFKTIVCLDVCAKVVNVILSAELLVNIVHPLPAT